MNNSNELRLKFDSHPPRAKGAFRTLRLIGLVLGLFLSFGLSPVTAMSLKLEAAPKPVALGPGTVFGSVEEAAFDALLFASLKKGQRYRGRVQAGTIFRVGDGFGYREPTASQKTVWSTDSPVVRLHYTEADVASYVVHPRSGHSDVDRANEGLRPSMQRRIERSKTSARPLFLLTPKRRVIRYAPGEKAEVPSRLERGNLVVSMP